MSHHYSGPKFGFPHGDGIAAHKDLLTEFPYLGPPRAMTGRGCQFVGDSKIKQGE
jgi:hypothetical protein